MKFVWNAGKPFDRQIPLGGITGLVEKGTTVETRFTDTCFSRVSRFHDLSHAHDFSRLVENSHSRKIVEF